jgi:hypothetical protein
MDLGGDRYRTETALAAPKPLEPPMTELEAFSASGRHLVVTRN